MGYPALDRPFTDILIAGADRFLQLSTTAFEYARDDLPDTLKFIGTLKQLTWMMQATAYWLPDDERPLVIVTQSTLANTDLQQLIVPTLHALADLPVRVLATTGGRSVDGLYDHTPENARVKEFISLDHWLPQAALLITNGGYGSVNAALSHGVPLVIADVDEDKKETAARVIWAGCGINLRTSKPDERRLRQTVEHALSTPSYRQYANMVRDDYAAHDALTAIAEQVDEFVSH